MNHNYFYISLITLLFLGCTNTSESSKSKLSPDEWFNKYIEAWTVCNKQIPITIATANNILNPEHEVNRVMSKISYRRQKVHDLVKENFPNLYSYVKIPEYKTKLSSQDHYKFNKIMYDYELELEQNNYNKKQLKVQNSIELEETKKRIESYFERIKLPNYD